ncbi:MAG: SGNH/GDSL hydrolase family protein [Planctomycetes bacterium]|nr:SGNH/GDSL hydrolase family protein [Planctomycetota bacterium]
MTEPAVTSASDRRGTAGPRGLIARAALAVAVPVLLLALTELIVATSGAAPPAPDPLVLWNESQEQELAEGKGRFEFHPHWLWEPRPGAVFWGDAINEGGYRGTYYARARSSRPRIAVMGDSSTFGHGLPESQVWGRVLETVLRENGYDVEVLNFGVIGFTVAQGCRLYVERVRGYRPDVVIASFGAANDVIPAPVGFTDEEKIALVSQRTYRLRVFLRRYETFRLLEHWLEPDAKAAAPATPAGDLVTNRVPIAVFEARLRDLAREVQADGARLVLVSPPRRQDGETRYPITLEYTGAIERAAAELGLPLADVRGPLRERDREELGEDHQDPAIAARSTLFIDPWHPSARGHAIYAALVGQTLRDAGLLTEAPGR